MKGDSFQLDLCGAEMFSNAFTFAICADANVLCHPSQDNKRGEPKTVVMKTFITFFERKKQDCQRCRPTKKRADDNDEDYMNNCRWRAEVIHGSHVAGARA